MADKINVEIVSEYDDADAKKALADAEKIDKLDPEITVTADDQASADIDQVGNKAEALSREDIELIIQARVDSALADLSRVDSQLKQTEEQAQRTNRQLDDTTGGGGGGLKTRGNAIADLTGPLGEASSAASDFAGVMDGVGDIAEDMSRKIGLSETAAAGVGSAIGGLGILVAGAAAAWSIWKSRQDEAKKKQQELIDKTQKWVDLFRQGEGTQAAESFVTANQKLLDLLDAEGVSVTELFDAFNNGKTSLSDIDTRLLGIATRLSQLGPMDIGNAAEIERLTAERDRLQDLEDQAFALKGAWDESTASGKRHDDQVAAAAAGFQQATDDGEDFHDSLHGVNQEAKNGKVPLDNYHDSLHDVGIELDDTRTALEKLKGELDMEERIDTVTDSIRDFEDTLADSDSTMEDVADQARETKQAILEYSEGIKDIPPVVQTEVAALIDEGKYAEALRRLQFLEHMREVKVRVTLVDRFGHNIGGISADRLEDLLEASGTSLPAPAPGVPTATPMAVSAGATTVNVNMPAGSRGVDVLRQVSGQTRRSGRRYGVPVVHYARRAG